MSRWGRDSSPRVWSLAVHFADSDGGTMGVSMNRSLLHANELHLASTLSSSMLSSMIQQLIFLMTFLILGGCAELQSPYGHEGQVFYDFIPPNEYIVDAPVYYDDHPGVAFYPLYIDAPGSCFCVMPMRYVDGAWYGVGGREIYRGYFVYHRPPEVQIDRWRAGGGVINGKRPVFGSIVQSNGQWRPNPPMGTIHDRVPTGLVNENHFNERRNNGGFQSQEGMRPWGEPNRPRPEGIRPQFTAPPALANPQRPNSIPQTTQPAQPAQEHRELPRQTFQPQQELRREPAPLQQRESKPPPEKNRDCRREKC